MHPSTGDQLLQLFPLQRAEWRHRTLLLLMCETTYSPHKPVDKERIIEETIQGLINSGMITEDERSRIVSRYLIDIPYSYPVPTLGRTGLLGLSSRIWSPGESIPADASAPGSTRSGTWTTPSCRGLRSWSGF